MSSPIITIISSILVIIIGLWKFFRGKDRKRDIQKKEILKKNEEANKNNDVSGHINAWDDSNNIL